MVAHALTINLNSTPFSFFSLSLIWSVYMSVWSLDVRPDVKVRDILFVPFFLSWIHNRDCSKFRVRLMLSMSKLLPPSSYPTSLDIPCVPQYPWAFLCDSWCGVFFMTWLLLCLYDHVWNIKTSLRSALATFLFFAVTHSLENKKATCVACVCVIFGRMDLCGSYAWLGVMCMHVCFGLGGWSWRCRSLGSARPRGERYRLIRKSGSVGKRRARRASVADHGCAARGCPPPGKLAGSVGIHRSWWSWRTKRRPSLDLCTAQH